MIKVINVISDANIGGAGKCLITYLANANTSAFDLSVALPKDSLLIPDLIKLKVKYFEIDGLFNKSFDIKAVLALKKLFAKEKPDIVHTHASLSARIAARLYGRCKVAYTRHSVFEPPKSISKGPGKLINGAFNNYLCDGIIAVAEAAKQNLTDTGVSEKKITVILNGIDPPPIVSKSEAEELKNSLKIETNEKVVAIIARLTAVKGHKYFIKAAKTLTDKGVNAKYLIAGTGEAENDLKELTKSLSMENRVIFTGFIKDILPLISICDVTVNASYGTEATSLSLLEAMSMGKPAVVSNFGGNPGVIADGVNGFVVEKQNEKALAAALLRLLENDTLYEHLSNNAKRIFNEKFRAQTMSLKIQEFYKSLL